MTIKESDQWRPVSPWGVPHAVAEGRLNRTVSLLLSQSSPIIVLNAWGMHHDSKQWQEPQHFQPERFAGLGVGLCRIRTPRPPELRGGPAPGIHWAERNWIISVAKLLWAF
ncbi:hypothetical protein N7537_008122 [Penicillium hordei]|uniref:Uncharacterized protein n=1 Tax=Penicillium hordei TaxID=40994 RepID=A0AAD6H1C7_9EURO|nr:uncharacterized protein N7537_008122 [Penicillium hordei]KAJ5598038.1 hypothetical protein N7537_008122 [Penicillium hordei]